MSINEDGSAAANPALLDLKSTNKGLLIPRMSSSQRKDITGAAAGLLVFDLDKSTIYLFDGQKWQAMLFTGSDAVNPPISRTASDATAGDIFGVGVTGKAMFFFAVPLR